MKERDLRYRMDELEWIEYKRRQTKRKLQKSHKRMQLTYATLTDSSPVPEGKWSRALYFADRGFSVWQGLKTGYKFADFATTLVSIRKMFKKKEK